MSRSQQRRVNRLWRVAGPCDACAERELLEIEQERTQRELRETVERCKARDADPAWLNDEAARLASRADELERNGGEDDMRAAAQHEASSAADEDTRETLDRRRVRLAQGCRRCQEAAELLPSPDVVRLARRVRESLSEQEFDPIGLRETAQRFQARANELQAAEDSSK